MRVGAYFAACGLLIAGGIYGLVALLAPPEKIEAGMPPPASVTTGQAVKHEPDGPLSEREPVWIAPTPLYPDATPPRAMRRQFGLQPPAASRRFQRPGQDAASSFGAATESERAAPTPERPAYDTPFYRDLTQ